MFVDAYLPDSIRSYNFQGAAVWSTTITRASGGSEHRNQNWENPLHRFTAPEAIRCWDDLEDLKDAWYALGGPANTFAFRDPMDFASVRLTTPDAEPAVGPTNQTLGMGDGAAREFQLRKAYAFGGRTYYRTITLPVVDSVLVAMNALSPATANPTLPGGPYTWDVDRTTGIITFDHAPTAGVVITAGFLFDVEVRFESDESFTAMSRAFAAGGFPDLVLTEVRPC